ncbi:MAG: hypothetical protein MK212_04030 [Saprospiraceae bacterium]|nr:hypothetical protein [Saprospiraceae bacterium]
MGAGGTDGGTGRFLIGFFMFVGGLYLMLQSIDVNFGYGRGFFAGRGLFALGDFQVTSGYVVLIFMFGVAIMFYNFKNPLGWLLSLGAIAMLIFGVVSNTQFTFRSMNSFQLITICVLLCGGLGLLLSSFVAARRKAA